MNYINSVWQSKSKASTTSSEELNAFHKFSLNPEQALSVADREWSIIATHKTSGMLRFLLFALFSLPFILCKIEICTICLYIEIFKQYWLNKSG